MKYADIKSWGCDIGNVIVENGSNNLIPDCFDGIKHLIDSVGSENVFIISKASIAQQRLSRIFLGDFGFYSVGLLPGNVRFCLERLEKAPIIRELELQGHIDDRGEIIHSIQDFVQCPIWFRPGEDDYGLWTSKIRGDVYMFYSWKELIETWDSDF
jgi:hypothetical protein